MVKNHKKSNGRKNNNNVGQEKIDNGVINLTHNQKYNGIILKYTPMIQSILDMNGVEEANKNKYLAVVKNTFNDRIEIKKGEYEIIDNEKIDYKIKIVLNTTQTDFAKDFDLLNQLNEQFIIHYIDSDSSVKARYKFSVMVEMNPKELLNDPNFIHLEGILCFGDLLVNPSSKHTNIKDGLANEWMNIVFYNPEKYQINEKFDDYFKTIGKTILISLNNETPLMKFKIDIFDNFNYLNYRVIDIDEKNDFINFDVRQGFMKVNRKINRNVIGISSFHKEKEKFSLSEFGLLIKYVYEDNWVRRKFFNQQNFIFNDDSKMFNRIIKHQEIDMKLVEKRKNRSTKKNINIDKKEKSSKRKDGYTYNPFEEIDNKYSSRN